MENDLDDISYQRRKELQDALRKFTIALEPNLFMTAVYNVDGMSHDRSKKILCTWQRSIDRQLFGRRFYQLPPDRRMFFIAMPEHMRSHPHHHALVRIPNYEEFVFHNAELELQKIVPSATVKIFKLTTQTDVRATSYYSCKDTIHPVNYDKFILSTEFVSFKKK